jgi:hypothetical protein
LVLNIKGKINKIDIKSIHLLKLVNRHVLKDYLFIASVFYFIMIHTQLSYNLLIKTRIILIILNDTDSGKNYTNHNVKIHHLEFGPCLVYL